MVNCVYKITLYVLFYPKNGFHKIPKRRFKLPNRKRFAHTYHRVCTFFICINTLYYSSRFHYENDTYTQLLFLCINV